MGTKRKATIFAALAGVFAASTAPIAALPTVTHVFIVLPLVLMGIFLFFAGYYAGLSRKNTRQ